MIGQKILNQITVKLNLIQLMKTNIVENFERQKTSEIRKENLEEQCGRAGRIKENVPETILGEKHMENINKRGKELESKLSS